VAAIRNNVLQEDYSAGMVRHVAPHLIPKDGAYDITNKLLNEDGSTYRRGGTEYKTSAAFGAFGTFLWDGYTPAGRRTLVANNADFGVMDAADTAVVNLAGVGVPYDKGAAYLKGLLFIGGGNIYGGSRKAANYSTGTVTLTAGSANVVGAGTLWAANIDPGMLIQFNNATGTGTERVYVVKSVTNDTNLVLTEPYEAGTAGAGRVYLATRIYAIQANDPYKASEAYCVAANRLVVIDPNDPQSILFSEINKPHDYTNQFETTNSHSHPEGSNILGFGYVGDTLIVFTTGGAWSVQGMGLDIVDADGASQHRKQIVSRDMVLWGQAGIGTWEQMLIVPCTNGVYLMDGTSSPRLLSQNISPLYDFFVERTYRVGGAQVYRNHYILPIIGGSGDVREFLVCRLSALALDRRRRNTFAWVHFTGTMPVSLGIRYGDATSTRTPVLVGIEGDATARVINCSAFFEPSAGRAADADGSNHEGSVITRDYETGNLTLNTVRALVTRYVLEDAAATNPELEMSWSDGSTSGEAAGWGENNWNSFNWSANAASFESLTPPAPEDAGTNPHHQRVGKRVRHIRIKTRNTISCAAFILRSQEIRIRPSQATRR
jgi:hypothetical protein